MKLMNIAISKLKPNENNPRSFARDQDLEDLGRSIEAHGIIEPLVVRKIDDGNYQVLAGHRRLMAAEGVLDELPCVIREEDAGDGLVIALVENTQRVDLTPFEQAQAIGKAIGTMKQKDLAKAIGRSPTYVSKFVTIMKAAKKLAAQGDDVEQMTEYTNMEELYEYAKGVLGLAQKPLDLGEPEQEEGAGEGDAAEEELTDIEALDKAIDEHARLAKVKPANTSYVLECVDPDGRGYPKGHVIASIVFKNMRDAEKFFLAYGVKA